MIEIATQNINNTLKPFSQEDKEALQHFKPNQILKCKVSGIRKERSVPQLRLLHACLRTVSENTDDPQWDSVEKAKIQLKHILHFFKSTVVLPNGSIHFELDSFSFANLSQIDANKVCDRSFPILAKKIGVTTKELLANAQ